MQWHRAKTKGKGNINLLDTDMFHTRSTCQDRAHPPSQLVTTMSILSHNLREREREGGIYREREKEIEREREKERERE